MKFMKVWLLIGMGFGVVTAPAAELFDMAAIRDASTLDVKVLKDWYPVRGEVMTRQKLITIRVGELVPGKEYRLPVRLIVPCLLYTSPSPRDQRGSRMPSSA